MHSKRIRCEEGALTIEAALVLSIFLLAFLSWSLLLFRIRVEAMTQFALDQTALALSDRLSTEHALRQSKDAAAEFLEAAQVKLPQLKIPGRFLEEINDLGMTLGTRALFATFYGTSEAANRAVQNMAFGVDVDDQRDLLQLDLYYEWEMPGILKPLGPIPVQQQAVVGVWVLTDQPILTTQEEKEEEGTSESIWQKPPFQRGRTLVERRRKQEERYAVEKGQVIDLAFPDHVLESVFSLHLFSRTYAAGQGNDAKEYQVKEEQFMQQLQSHARMMKKAVAARPTLVLENGTEIQTEEAILRMTVVMPEEATLFEEVLQRIAGEIYQKEGVLVRYVFEEKAFPENTAEDSQKQPEAGINP